MGKEQEFELGSQELGETGGEITGLSVPVVFEDTEVDLATETVRSPRGLQRIRDAIVKDYPGVNDWLGNTMGVDLEQAKVRGRLYVIAGVGIVIAVGAGYEAIVKRGEHVKWLGGKMVELGYDAGFLVKFLKAPKVKNKLHNFT